MTTIVFYATQLPMDETIDIIGNEPKTNNVIDFALLLLRALIGFIEACIFASVASFLVMLPEILLKIGFSLLEGTWNVVYTFCLTTKIIPLVYSVKLIEGVVNVLAELERLNPMSGVLLPKLVIIYTFWAFGLYLLSIIRERYRRDSSDTWYTWRSGDFTMFAGDILSFFIFSILYSIPVIILYRPETLKEPNLKYPLDYPESFQQRIKLIKVSRDI